MRYMPYPRVETYFLQHIHLLLMSPIAGSRKLTPIANLIGERGEMAKQPLPDFIEA